MRPNLSHIAVINNKLMLCAVILQVTQHLVQPSSKTTSLLSDWSFLVFSYRFRVFIIRIEGIVWEQTKFWTKRC